MMSALIVGAADDREIALRIALLSATNYQANLTVVQGGDDAVQILRSIRFEIMVVDLRGGEDAATKVLELLRVERPEDLDHLLLISDTKAPSVLRGQARMIEGDEFTLRMPSLGRLIARAMCDVVPEMRVWTA